MFWLNLLMHLSLAGWPNRLLISIILLPNIGKQTLATYNTRDKHAFNQMATKNVNFQTSYMIVLCSCMDLAS